MVLSTVQSYSAGNTIYGSGSSAATDGTVDPMGYIQRELEKKRAMMLGGTDGQSDTRSGLASAALNRTQGFTTGGDQTTNATTSHGTTMPASGGLTGNGGVVPLPTAGTSAPVIPQSPISASPTGALQYPQLNLPFDLDLAQERTKALDKFNQEEAANQTGLQRAARQRVTDQSSLDTSIPVAFRQLLNHFSGRGMAFSSGYGTGVGEANRSAMGQQDQIDTNYNDASANSQTNHLNSENDFLNMLNSLGITQSQRAAANAGTLNLDPNYVDPADAPHVPAPPSVPYSGGGTTKKAVPAPVSNAAKRRTSYLAGHPALKALIGHPAKKAAFLKSHPKIAKEWRAAR